MVSVLIITYNSEQVIRACVESCLRFAASEVIVIDNASTDGTAAAMRECAGGQVQAVWNGANRGFAGAVNQGMRLAKGELVLLLNPDAVLQTPLDALVARFGNAEVGAVAGRLVDAAGNDQWEFQHRNLPSPLTLAFEVLGLNRLFPWNRVNRRYRPAQGTRAEQPAAAFLMIRRAAWEQVGGFDENFHPVWFEDVDFCKRIADAGWRIEYEPGALAGHIGGHSAARIGWESRQKYWYGSLLKYASKHFTGGGERLVAGAVVLACVPRMLAGVASMKSFEPVKVFSNIGWLASRYLLGRAEVTGAGGRRNDPQIGQADAARTGM